MRSDGSQQPPWLEDLWRRFSDHESVQLLSDDDPELWRAVVYELFTDAEAAIAGYRGKASVGVQVGCCSRWLRPHQTRWKADGGLAWPKGYGDTLDGDWQSFPSGGLPELDWSSCWQRVSAECWQPVDRLPGRRPLRWRIAVPARSGRHDSAALHTLWTPGSPVDPRAKVSQFYGFRRRVDQWELVAHLAHHGAERLYDAVAGSQERP